jgi:hypothetical protein
MKKILSMLFMTFFVLAMFVAPSIAMKPSDPIPISYYKETIATTSLDIKFMPLQSSVFYIVTRSDRYGVIKDYTDNVMGPVLFDFTQVGKYVAMRSESRAVWMQVWNFELEMTSITMEGGFRGILNGKAYQTTDPGTEPFTVKGVLQGFGDDFRGKKLVVEMVRGPDPLITGVLIEH